MDGEGELSQGPRASLKGWVGLFQAVEGLHGLVMALSTGTCMAILYW